MHVCGLLPRAPAETHYVFSSPSTGLGNNPYVIILPHPGRAPRGLLGDSRGPLGDRPADTLGASQAIPGGIPPGIPGGSPRMDKCMLWSLTARPRACIYPSCGSPKEIPGSSWGSPGVSTGPGSPEARGPRTPPGFGPLELRLRLLGVPTMPVSKPASKVNSEAQLLRL